MLSANRLIYIYIYIDKYIGKTYRNIYFYGYIHMFVSSGYVREFNAQMDTAEMTM